MKETMDAVVPEVADLVVLHGGNEKLVAYASRLLSAGKPVIPIVPLGGASKLLVKCARHWATPREVARLTSYGVILEREQKALVLPAYDSSSLPYRLAQALEMIAVNKPSRADHLPSADVSLADVITQKAAEAEPDPNAALEDAIIRSILEHGKRKS